MAWGMGAIIPRKNQGLGLKTLKRTQGNKFGKAKLVALQQILLQGSGLLAKKEQNPSKNCKKTSKKGQG